MSTPDTVDRALRLALHDTAEASLDIAASLLAADPAADTELLRRGVEFVSGAWARGWMPADVVRVVRRELGDRHVRPVVESILAQAPGDVPRCERWAAQVRDLDRHDGEPAAGDRFSRATVVLESYRLLVRLPVLEALEGDGRDGPRRGPGRPAESRLLTRVRALLAKAEATDFPDEAEALTAKAQELIARHGLETPGLAGSEVPAGEAPTARRVGVDPPYEGIKALLLDAVAGANGCRAVWQEDLGFSTVVGFEHDLEVVELLYASLSVQADAAMVRAEAVERAGGRKRTKTFRRSFLAAYAGRVGGRLREVARAAHPEDGGTLPVRAAREVAVDDRVERMFPRATATRLRGVDDEAGWVAGTDAADRARVAAPRALGGRRG
ncbi:DUF2786 domain-containing protein [Streptomyces sp. HSG2]|uniref:DUF2786 domain-containing protein n=1 Tax=Streptomyces sp. HSG2 TaxID=2797167 RepID=UPI0019048CF0|nr:DUF2786 domain-containing protein [Streptomyces sp. HSG2]